MSRINGAGLLNSYRIFETDEFINCMKLLPKSVQLFMKKKLTSLIYPQLRDEPHYGSNIKKLVDFKIATWRYRIGKYRLFYEINEEEKIVYILTVYLRRDSYRN